MKRALALLVALIISISIYAKEFSVFKYNNHYGVIDNNRKVIIPPEYDRISKTDQAYFFCYDSNDSLFIYSPDVKLIYSIKEKTSLTRYSDYEYIVKKRSDSNFYLLNLKTLKLSEYQKSGKYMYEYAYSDDVALVMEVGTKNVSYSIADINGNIILRDIEQADIVFSDGLLAVWMEDGKSGFVDKTGKFVIETKFYRNLADEGPRKFPALGYFFNEGLGIVQSEKGVWKILDKKGNETLIPNSIHLYGGCFVNGLIVVKDENKKFGYMNSKAEIAIPYIFDSASTFEGKYAMVVYDSKDAVIDKKGKIFLCEDIMLKQK